MLSPLCMTFFLKALSIVWGRLKFAPCEDMLPYMPIWILKLWNVRKCVVSGGIYHHGSDTANKTHCDGLKLNSFWAVLTSSWHTFV